MHKFYFRAKVPTIRSLTHTKGHFSHKPRAMTMKIVGAQKKVFKGRVNTPPKPWSVVTDPQVYWEVIRDRDLNHLLIQ
jgi:hypothetical protein